jgi:AraC-like DNA-binding protein
MDYKTFNPGNELSTFIKCYWTLESPKVNIPEKQRIVPDGCMEMIFHHGDLYRQFLDENNSIIQPKCFVFGQITSPLEIEPTGETGIFAARFHPDGFLPFASMPLKNMENKAVPLEVLFDKEGLRLEIEVLKAQNTKQRIELVEKFLAERLSTPQAVDRIIESTVKTMLAINEQLSIDEISQKLNINRRQLERKFSSVIGLSPKQLSKIFRLQRTLKMLLSNEYTSLTALAHKGNYYDQAHFIKDFKEFTGLTPKEFYADNLKMSSLFYRSE